MPAGKSFFILRGARHRARRHHLINALQQYGTLIALAVLVIFNLTFTPGFRSTLALHTNLIQVAPIVIVATGMTLMIATGGIDLSVGSLMAIAGALAPIVFQASVWPLNQQAVGTVLAFVLLRGCLVGATGC